MFRFTVPPASCGKKVCRSVALRMPSFSMSLGRYVSTGFGPVSSAVGMFEPVTMTRSTSAVLDSGVGEGFWPDTIDARKSATTAFAAKTAPTDRVLSCGFISDQSGRTKFDYMGCFWHLQVK